MTVKPLSALLSLAPVAHGLGLAIDIIDEFAGHFSTLQNAMCRVAKYTQCILIDYSG
jgi:hypothetical protein